MAAAEVEAMPPASEAPASEAPAPGLPDYMTDPNAVLGDLDAEWRYGKPPDYTNTRRVFAASMVPIPFPIPYPCFPGL
jgi:hypothetical protein